MRHRKSSRRLGRPKAAREALLRSLVIALLEHQRIKTTRMKARFARSAIDHLILLGKEATLQARRKALRILHDRSAVRDLFSRIAPLFKEKKSGFSRVIRLPSARRGDGAEMALLELTEKLPRSTSKEVKKAKVVKTAEPPQKTEPPKTEPAKPKLHKERLKLDKKLKPRKFLGGLRGLFKKERDSL